MRNLFTYTALISVFVFLFSCSSPKYFYDQSSLERQKELKKDRSGNVLTDIGIGIISIFSSAALDVDFGWYPSEQEFKKIKLINPCSDTMYINMLTDVYWDKEDYCDFMDIRIPPKTTCKVLVPVNANYNLYFSKTPEDTDDEMLEIFTSDIKRISLYPGITVENDTINLN
ncbi:MAG: hypothetical protein HQ522_19620 [Bacteroidetes bacterium]|nr:hypothetical protein [Bacteroidota bacterium]